MTHDKLLEGGTAKVLDIYARTIYGEARGESWTGKLAVAWTIRNRADRPNWWGKTITEVCLKPWQYSCWLHDDPNSAILRAVTLEDAKFRECLAAACLVYNKAMGDPTSGATHYYALSMDKPPKWAASMKALTVIGGHRFYRDKAT